MHDNTVVILMIIVMMAVTYFLTKASSSGQNKKNQDVKKTNTQVKIKYSPESKELEIQIDKQEIEEI